MATADMLPSDTPARPLAARRKLVAQIRAVSARHPVTLIAAPAGFGKSALAALAWHAEAGPRGWLALDRLSEQQRWPALRAFVAVAVPGALMVVDAIDCLPDATDQTWRECGLDGSGPYRLLLTTRRLSALPLLDAWRARGGLALFDAAHICPTPADWQQVFGRHDTSMTNCGAWWALRLAGDNAAARIDWLRRVYFPGLVHDEAAVLGALTLEPDASPATLGSWLSIGGVRVAQALHALAIDGAPVAACRANAELGATLAAAWCLHQPSLALQFAEAAFEDALALRDAPRSIRVAQALADPQACVRLLDALGWLILLGPRRAMLGELLSGLSRDAARLPAMRLLRAAWWVELARAPVEAERILRTDRLAGPQADAIQARCKLMYDDAEGAAKLAESALAGIADCDAPEALLAAAAQGYACLERADPARAIAVLRDVVSAARRDGFANLELDGLHVLARAQQEHGDDTGLAESLRQAQAHIEQAGLAGETAAQSIARLALLDAHEHLQAPAPILPPPVDSDFFAFPWLVARAREALMVGRIGEAMQLGEQLDSRLHANFCSTKWRLEAAYVGIWIAGLRGDVEVLRRHAGDAGLPPSDAGLHAWAGAVHRAAAALLMHKSWPATQLQALIDALAQRGLHRLQVTARLIAALSDPSGAAALLGDWLHLAVRSGRLIDALWLAPCLIDPLARWLRHPGAVLDPAVRAAAMVLFARLQPPAAESPRLCEAARPRELTEREWQVLQLIGQQFSNEQISVTLHVSLPTVKTHINRLYAKLAISTRAEAMQRARALQAAPTIPPA